jgi:hypothetical protein
MLSIIRSSKIICNYLSDISWRIIQKPRWHTLFTHEFSAKQCVFESFLWLHNQPIRKILKMHFVENAFVYGPRKRYFNDHWLTFLKIKFLKNKFSFLEVKTTWVSIIIWFERKVQQKLYEISAIVLHRSFFSMIYLESTFSLFLYLSCSPSLLTVRLAFEVSWGQFHQRSRSNYYVRIPQKCKKDWQLECLFALSWSSSVTAAHRMLMKLTTDRKII